MFDSVQKPLLPPGCASTLDERTARGGPTIKKPEKLPSTGAEVANRDLFLSPSTIGDSDETPLLDRARENIASTDYAEEAAKDEAHRERKRE